MAEPIWPAVPASRPGKASRPAPATARVRFQAGAGLVLERVWPTVLALVATIALYAILSWFGVFAALSDWPRLGLLVLLGVAGLAALLPLRRFRLPARAEIETRIEAASLLQHQPLQAQSDRPSGDDPFAIALWREHQARMAARLRGLRGGALRTGTERLDPYALRTIGLLLLATSYSYSFGPGGGRLGDAFRPVEAELVAGTRLDAWATPPGYTGRAPIFLTGTDGAPAPDGAVDVPQGTVVSVRLSDPSGASVRFQPEGGEAVAIAPTTPPATDGAAAGAGGDEAAPSGAYEFALPASGTVTVETALRSLGAFRFSVLPDVPPQIRFDGEPQVARNGALQIPFLVRDDYGAAGGEGVLTLREAVAPGARPLVAPPEIALSMPRRTKGEAKGRTTIDVTDSPYAGAKVALTLRVRDDAGQVGESAPLEMTLPARRFADPLARAVVEQRRILALDANRAPRVVEMIDAATLRGDEFIRNPADYLALRAARERIANAADDDTLRSAVDFLWQIAVGIEDGDMADSQRRLRDAQERLSEALENNASEQEIAAAMEELREAMREVMQAMAEAMRNMPPQDQAQMGDAQEIRPQDLDRMMDRIEDLARSGSREAAKQLLAELQDMMNNLQAMRPGQQQQGAQNQSPMQQQMNQLGEMLQRQQQLMDQTFELGRRQMQRDMQTDGERQEGQAQEGQAGQQGQQPMTAEEMQRRMQELQAQQKQLQQDLQQMQEAMRGQGMQPSQDFGQAGEAMGEAQGQIGQGNSEGAVGQQGRAMEALRRGAQDAMRQMQQAMGEGQGEGQQPGQGQQPGGTQMGQGYGPGQQRSGRDPLGRERQTQGPDFGQDVGVPDEIDIQRARRILDEIRDRLGHQLSPQQERDYLERLLRTP